VPGCSRRRSTTRLTGQPFANNQIPASRIDPAAARILTYIPLPQTAAATNNPTGTWCLAAVFCGEPARPVPATPRRLPSRIAGWWTKGP
jgi:hypothetical protein